MPVDYVVLSQAGASAQREQSELKMELVRRLLIKGIHLTREIQTTLKNMDPPLDLNIRTINKYKKILQRRNLQAISRLADAKKTVEEIAIELKAEFEEVTKELWIQYHDPKTTKMVKVVALSQIRETADKYVKIFQSLGLVHEAPVKHQLIGADGQPITPESKIRINEQFTAFVKAQFQAPLGVDEKPIEGELVPQAPAT